MSPRIGIRCAYKAETVLIEIFDQAAKTSFFANIIRFACLKDLAAIEVLPAGSGRKRSRQHKYGDVDARQVGNRSWGIKT